MPGRVFSVEFKRKVVGECVIQPKTSQDWLSRKLDTTGKLILSVNTSSMVDMTPISRLIVTFGAKVRD